MKLKNTSMKDIKGMLNKYIGIITGVLCAIHSCNLDNNTFLSQEQTKVSNNKSQLAPIEYVKWVEDIDNGIKVKKTIGDFTFSVLYKPYEYIVAKELRISSISTETLKKKMNEIDELQYFTFRIEADNANTELLRINLASENEYNSRIEYFSFNMQKDLKLIDGKDTLDCVLFHFERVYNIAPYATFVLGFPLVDSKKKKEDKQVLNNKVFIYDDKVFGTGKIYLTIKAENSNNIPQLITN